MLHDCYTLPPLPDHETGPACEDYGIGISDSSRYARLQDAFFDATIHLSYEEWMYCQREHSNPSNLEGIGSGDQGDPLEISLDGLSYEVKSYLSAS